VVVCGSGHSPPTLLTLVSLLPSYIYTTEHTVLTPLSCMPHRSLVPDTLAVSGLAWPRLASRVWVSLVHVHATARRPKKSAT
jgi:hypothetical protein